MKHRAWMCLVILFICVSCGGDVEEVVEAPVWSGDINMSDGDIYVDAVADIDDILEISGGTREAHFTDIIDMEYAPIGMASSEIERDYGTYSAFTFTSPDGRTASIDFSGESITYTGDLPVDESAKLFFEAYGDLCRKCPE